MAAADADYPPERAAQAETLIEKSGPDLADYRCTCNLCMYGVRPKLTVREVA